MCETRNSSLLVKITVVVVICFFGLPAQGKYGGGTGEPNDPYLIYTAEQMNAIGANPADWDKHFLLMADIDLSGYIGPGHWPPPPPSPPMIADVDSSVYTMTIFNIIGRESLPFTGVFDGNNHTISNFTCSSMDTDNIGLFGYVYYLNAEIKNLGLIDPHLYAGAGDYVGSLVGFLWDGTIANCYVEGGSVSGGSFVGGLVGYNWGTITNCYSAGNVTGEVLVGGLVGDCGGTITDCSSTDTVFGEYQIGGLVGLNHGGVSNSYSTGSVIGSGTVGGLLGRNGGAVTKCYSTGSVSGTSWVGGLVGGNYYGTVSNCYSTSSVSGNGYVGGLVGYLVGLNYGEVSNSYSIGSVEGTTDVGGLVGYKSEGTVIACFWDIETSGQTTSDGGTGLPTAEMQTATTFIEWALELVWTIDEGNDYPRLAWENMPGEAITLGLYLYGDGTQDEPYLIYTAEQLNMIGFFPCIWDKCFKLMTDVDLSGYDGQDGRPKFNIIGYVTYPFLEIHPFTGVFDGNGKKIFNFTYTSTDTIGIGLFGCVGDPNAQIRNLGLIEAEVDAGMGGLVGSLVGCFGEGTITDCYVEGGSVSGGDHVGGLVGIVGYLPHEYNTAGIITNCYSAGNVTGTVFVGGLVGYNSIGTISNSYSAGDVTGLYNIGGLVGKNDGTITNSYSNASVLGDSYVGGLVGENILGDNYFGIISMCYSTGSVSGNRYVGGLVGQNCRFDCWWGICYGQVQSSFWDIETSGLTISDGGTGKTTAEMQMQVTFTGAGWRWCEPVWTIDEGVDYPRLVWENMPGELITAPSDLYGGGTGEPNDPYLIYTAEQLNTIGTDLYPCLLGKHFKLMVDIDLSGYTGTSFNIIGSWEGWDSPRNKPFTGVFDGDGYTISNFTYTSTGIDNIGLFEYVSGEIKNLGLTDPNVDAGTGGGVGSLVRTNSGTITNCYVEGGSISGSFHVGGLVGLNLAHGSVSNCYSTGSVSGDYEVGGLVGNCGGTINNCYSTVSVSGDSYAGGLVGSSNGTITKCYSTGIVTGDYGVGGLCGGGGTITNCYSAGNVSGTSRVGGLVGENYYRAITNCYSLGNVEGEHSVGGLVGYLVGYKDYFRITNCYSIGSVEGTTDVGGLVGFKSEGTVIACFWDIETSGHTSSSGGTGLTTTEMQMQTTFTDAGWDFVGETFNGIEDIWFIPQQDYPRLWWEGMQVPMKLTPRTLNCRSEGNWVKAHITLPQGFTVADVDSERPAVLHSFGFQSPPPCVFVNKDKLVEIEAAFERQAVCSLAGSWPDELTVAGFLTDGNIFLGTSTVRIIHPGMKVIEDLSWYWLNEDCVHPEFCNGIDTNRDSIVNLMDYALLLNSQVEFTRE